MVPGKGELKKFFGNTGKPKSWSGLRNFPAGTWIQSIPMVAPTVPGPCQEGKNARLVGDIPSGRPQGIGFNPGVRIFGPGKPGNWAPPMEWAQPNSSAPGEWPPLHKPGKPPGPPRPALANPGHPFGPILGLNFLDRNNSVGNFGIQTGSGRFRFNSGPPSPSLPEPMAPFPPRNFRPGASVASGNPPN